MEELNKVRVVFEIDMGNDAMQTIENAMELVEYTVNNRDLKYIDTLKLRDTNGNIIGTVVVEKTFN